MRKRNAVITIAGHDPSNGAGIGADLKVFEAWGLEGFSVVTAVTTQNAVEFLSPGWLAWTQIEAQLEGLFRKHRPHWFKIGLVQNADTLRRIVEWIRRKDPAAFILWDPILKASAGFDFHTNDSRQAFVDVCRHLSLVTPNAMEAEWLGDVPCPVLRKGGHAQGDLCIDVLHDSEGELARFEMPRLEKSAKHGSGCVLSATILALMALGYRLERACGIARSYLQEYLQSAPGLLGWVGKSLPQQWIAEARALDPFRHRLYAISWDGAGISHVQQVQELCRAGVGLVQLRMKSAAVEERLACAWQCLRITRQWGSTLVINDDVEIARATHAPAVHLGLTDMKVSDARKRLGADVWIGGTANTPEQVLARVTEGADYVGLGPWRYTDTKQNLSSILGESGVEQALCAVYQEHPGFPVYVIGGIHAQDCKEILDLGARGVAVSSGIVASSSIASKVQEYMNALIGQGSRI